MRPEASPPEPRDPDTGTLNSATWTEREVLGSPSERDQAFRLLARWLVSAVQKGAPGKADSPPTDAHNPLDVAPGPKVVSKAR